MKIEDTLNKFVEDICKSIWEETQNLGTAGVGISGSFARGDYSKSKPDINFALFIQETTPELLIKIGEILSQIDSKYSKYFNLHPDYHPERIVYPWEKDPKKPDVFFKMAFFQLRDKNLPMPFGRPGYVIEGHKNSIIIKYGKNFFANIKIESTNEQVIKGVNYTLPQWSRNTEYTPIAYNLKKDNELFFSESLEWGKIAIQQYAWIQGIKNGFDYSKEEDRKKVLGCVHDKEKLRNFIKIPKTEYEMLNLILDARLNFDKWKNDKDLAKKLYKASSHLLKYFTEEAKKFA